MTPLETRDRVARANEALWRLEKEIAADPIAAASALNILQSQIYPFFAVLNKFVTLNPNPEISSEDEGMLSKLEANLEELSAAIAEVRELRVKAAAAAAGLMALVVSGPMLDPPPPVAPRQPRNARCFCDSGKKYKKCHGSAMAPKDGPVQ